MHGDRRRGVAGGQGDRPRGSEGRCGGDGGWDSGRAEGSILCSPKQCYELENWRTSRQ